MTFRTGLTRWRAPDGDFDRWQGDGVAVGPQGALTLQHRAAQRGRDPHAPQGYHGRNFYNGGEFVVGEAVGPAQACPIPAVEAVASWNAATPPGTWIETLLRARAGGRWTAWYSMGVWADGASTVERHSVRHEDDAVASVETDVLALRDAAADAFQLKLRLFCDAALVRGAAAGDAPAPTVRHVALAYSTARVEPDGVSTPPAGAGHRSLALPRCSQMVYPDGGSVWCSPTAVAMVLGYWHDGRHDSRHDGGGPCEPRVRAAVEGVYDWLYDGHGNWPFNAAYAARDGLESYVARFTSLAEAAAWIEAGVPLVLSYGWRPGELAGARLPASNGHLVVLAGFDAAGDPVIHDPDAASDDTVRRVYRRHEIERLWLSRSGGTAYVVHPPDWSVPALEPGSR